MRIPGAIVLAIVVSCVASCLAFGQTYTISTVAGESIPLPNNIPGVQATLAPPPYGVAADSKGNLFFPNGGTVLRLDALTGIITVVAGNGTNGFSGDDGLATNAQLSQPFGIAVDPEGNVYIADSGNNRIRKVSNGVITTFVPGLGSPTGVAVDAAGNLFVADTGNHRVVKIANGVLTVVAGIGTPGFSGDGGPATAARLYNPSGVAVDSAGNLFISDSWNNRIREVANGTITTVAGDGAVPPGTNPGPPGPNLPPVGGFSGDGGLATSAELYDPIGISLDSAGNAYFADSYNGRIREVSGGTISTVVGGGTNPGDTGVALGAQISPFGVVVDSAGNIYIGDISGRVRKVSNGAISTVAGTGHALVVFSGDSGAATSAQLATPSGVTVDTSGNIYIADTGNQRIRKVSHGVITTVAGGGTAQGDNGPATSALLASPVGVAVDLAGNIYIADSLANRVRKVSNGVITTVAGTGTAGFSGDGGSAVSAQLFNPAGVAVDGSGNLYIADAYNNRIRQVSALTGVITTVAGNGVLAPSNGIPGGRGYGGFSGDGGPAINAQLSTPNSIAVDASGSFYFCDADNNRVRRVAGGTVNTVAGTGTDINNSGGLGGFSGDGGLAVNAQLATCEGVALDGSGNLFIAANQRIREVSRGLITTIAGGGTALIGDNGPAVGAALTPAGVSVDAAGNIYIADYLNSRVRELTAGTGPHINANGIVSIYSPLPVIQSGSWVSIYGTELAAATKVWNNDFPLSLGGTTVNIDDKPAALWVVSPTQINLQVPDDATTGTVSVSVTTQAGSVTSIVTMDSQAPSLSLLTDNKHVAAQIAIPNGVDLAGPSNTFSYATRPVKAGETLILYGVGFGATSPVVLSGKPFSGSAPTVNPVTVTIGGVDAKVTYSGIVLAGLYQINVTVPAVPAGDQPVVAKVNGAQTTPGPVVTVQ